jgi:hypothetical protein
MLQIPGETLWLGNVGDLWEPRGLFDAGITAVVDLAENEPLPKIPRDFIYCRFPLVDGIDNSPALLRLAIDTTVALLRARVPSLIYCSEGLSRSPAVAAGALAVVHLLPPQECLKRLPSHKGGFDVTPGMWEAVITVLAGKS